MGGCTVFTEVDWSLIEPAASGEGGEEAEAAGGENSNGGTSSNGPSGGQDNEGGEGGSAQGGEAGDGSGGTPSAGGAMAGGSAGTSMVAGSGGAAGTGGGGSGGSAGSAGVGGNAGGGVAGSGGVAGMGGKAGAAGAGSSSSGAAGVGGAAGSGGTAGTSGSSGAGGVAGNGGLGGTAGSGGSGGSSGNSGPIVLYDGGVSSQNMVWGGRAGLDAICAAKKITLALPQSQSRAYISVSATDEIVTMPARYGIPTNVPIVGTTGISLGFTWSSLIGDGSFGGQLQASLVDANVLPANALRWLSGSLVYGAFEQNRTCNGWTLSTADATIKARVGSPTATSKEWMNDAEASCDAAGSHVLCVAYNP